jgi:monofunctional biosynthetic peptidoglycan transglycosylase
MAKKIKKLIYFILISIIILHIIYIFTIGILSLIYIKVNPPISSLMIYRSIFYQYKAKPIKFVPINNIPRIFQRMIIYIEDGNFYKHNGIDFESLKEAYQTNKKFNKIISGASTITMQLARTLFLTPDRNYIRKYLEIIAAVEIDFIMPKKRILELYLNYIEFGKGIYGVGAASYYYFKKDISRLSQYEMAKLVTILASPIKYDVETALRSRKLRQRFFFLNQKFNLLSE